MDPQDLLLLLDHLYPVVHQLPRDQLVHLVLLLLGHLLVQLVPMVLLVLLVLVRLEGLHLQ